MQSWTSFASIFSTKKKLKSWRRSSKEYSILIYFERTRCYAGGIFLKSTLHLHIFGIFFYFPPPTDPTRYAFMSLRKHGYVMRQQPELGQCGRERVFKWKIGFSPTFARRWLARIHLRVWLVWQNFFPQTSSQTFNRISSKLVRLSNLYVILEE